jgi:hypothetical protein
MAGVLAVKIVTLGAVPSTASQVKPVDAKMGNTRVRIINTAALAARVAGGVLPVTQAVYDAETTAGRWVAA